MNILIVEPFFAGSHKQWAVGYQHNSQHNVDILSLPGRHWKWRMYGGAVSLAEKYLSTDLSPDLIIATDMLDLTTFLSLIRKNFHDIPIVLYFHENQLTYPWSPTDKDISLQRNNQYAFLNYTSALAADHVFFNSHFHLQSFTDALTPFLKQFPDHREMQNIGDIKNKSKVLHLGLDLKNYDSYKHSYQHSDPIILWNHRWEYDKNPELFFNSLFKIKEKGIPFKLIVIGESYKKYPPIFDQAKDLLSDQILHIGYVDSFEEYANLLWQADIIPVTSQQDFFGGSIVEALYCNCLPILPKRLAYPEHIPKDFHDQLFYTNDNEFYKKLESVILNFKNHPSYQYQNFVAHYDWRILAPHYDEVFNKIVNNRLQV